MGDEQPNQAKKTSADEVSADKNPLVFISHDSRDAEIAKAFSKLLKSVSAGMLKSFRSSDKEGVEGIEFGDEWYRRLMTHLESACDVVCIFTQHSLDRPWILYEAGVAKGKKGIPVLGVALGVPLAHVGTGPFYQFQNCEDDEDSLTKLVFQLCKRIPSLEPDDDVVREQVRAFKAKVDEILQSEGGSDESQADDSSMAKIYEEIKVMVRDLPDRIESQIGGDLDRIRRKRKRRFHPGMIEEMLHISSKMGPDPSFGLVVIASLFREDIPVFYDLAMETYRAVRSGGKRAANEALRRFRHFYEMLLHSPMGEIFVCDRDSHMALMELGRITDHFMMGLERPNDAEDEELSK